MRFYAYCTVCNNGNVMRFRNARQRERWMQVHYLTREHELDKITVWVGPS